MLFKNTTLIILDLLFVQTSVQVVLVVNYPNGTDATGKFVITEPELSGYKNTSFNASECSGMYLLSV